jgi:ubiquinone biosynthesis O-methyltransferase
MNKETLDLFACDKCSNDFHIEVYEKDSENSIFEGIIRCKLCNLWYPIYDGIANFLPSHLADKSRRDSFRKKWQINFEDTTALTDCDSSKDKKLQIDFFDADTHIYDENMENTPFWKANDWNCLKGWLPNVGSDKLLLDVGCGSGRASIPFARNGVKVVGLDISEQMVLRAKHKSEKLGLKDLTNYVVGDSENLPFRQNSFDAVLAFGVLHHVPTPQKMLQQMSKVLKNDGLYFGHENNKTILRPLFDIMMKISRLWIEEAGNHPLIAKSELTHWAKQVNLDVKIKSSVFLPPHLYNLLGDKNAKRLITFSDNLLNRIPCVKNMGGILIIQGKKSLIAFEN